MTFVQAGQSRRSVEWVRSPDLKKADTAQEILKPGIGPQRIEGRPHVDGWVDSRLIGLIQPYHRLILIAEAKINQANAGIYRGVLTLSLLQVPNYLHRFLFTDRNGVRISEISVKCIITSG